jgi:hypothetical protein
MTTCSLTDSAAASTRPPYAAALSVPATPPVSSRCASTIYGTPHGSLLVAGGIDLPSVKAAMGHSHVTTTERYLHARPAGELADRFTRALDGASAVSAFTHAA